MFKKVNINPSLIITEIMIIIPIMSLPAQLLLPLPLTMMSMMIIIIIINDQHKKRTTIKQ